MLVDAQSTPADRAMCASCKAVPGKEWAFGSTVTASVGCCLWAHSGDVPIQRRYNLRGRSRSTCAGEADCHGVVVRDGHRHDHEVRRGYSAGQHRADDPGSAHTHQGLRLTCRLRTREDVQETPWLGRSRGAWLRGDACRMLGCHRSRVDRFADVDLSTEVGSCREAAGNRLRTSGPTSCVCGGPRVPPSRQRRVSGVDSCYEVTTV
ncbi:MAG: hypothetical protein JWL83_4302 [Actinomycetia bacterium]|nr:hypothetical protein [Actinomycetes bacterium]